MTGVLPSRPPADRPRVVLGVAGGIAAYKAVELLRLLTESGHDVQVVPTASALKFVGAPTWAALSSRPVSASPWDDVHVVPHVRTGQTADLVVVAPATADLLARAAHGLADDLLTNTLLTARCPVVLVPAMHTEMWEHPATRDNVALLRSRGTVVVEPAVGRLTGADSGKGRLPDPEEIARLCRRVLARGGLAADLTGRTVLVTAGGTREHLDPVRFLGNRSSGRQGHALARCAVARGARVLLVTAAALPDVAGADTVRVTSAQELRDAALDAAPDCDAVVMAAAVSDYRPVERLAHKRKKTGTLTVELVQNPDVLAELVAARRPGQVLVGFAAETGDEDGDALEHGRRKLARKGCDLLVVNEVGEPGHPTGFEGDDNAATVLGADGSAVRVPLTSKDALSDAVWDLVVPRLAASGPAVAARSGAGPGR
ncbi:MAG: bifunctional phosphopantothenoylcysteine decarboxylase/phosphopantothenate--cysteine ligase CoaBC [Actinomycetota bacterium]|nr:bifunctional phosphopantothenoylcysteine decarboxylase/phosphopantothenate--cysteine ligase CoaBC [Actinomycetota bacterium]